MTEPVGDFCYSKKDLIGHGAFAVVFKGQHRKKDDFFVAIKVISKKNLSKSQSLLAKEIKILKELHHDNVVALYDYQESPSSVFLVMEYCNGGDLADYLQAKGTLSEDTIRIFLKQIASAMSVLKSKGIVHRDLKPQNLLLNHSGTANLNPAPSEIKIKIADFGFARFLPGEMMAATLCGSPMYMAPEVIMSKAYDAKADLWSLGTIVYQCLTGKAPFQANSPQALKRFYEKNKGVCPNIPAGTSNHLKELLTGLLRRNPRDRMDFGDFFSHPFLTGIIVQRSSTPVAVPSSTRQRNYSGSSQGTRSPSGSSSPSYGAEALGDIRVDLLHRMTPPFDLGAASPTAHQEGLLQSPRNEYRHQVGQRLSSGFDVPNSPRQDEDLESEDFVMVPNAYQDTTDGPNRTKDGWDAYFPYDCHSSPQTSPNSNSPQSPPRRATFVVGSPSSSPSSPPVLRPRTQSVGNEPKNSAPIPLCAKRCSSPGLQPSMSPRSPRSLTSAPIPVPRKISNTSTPSSGSQPKFHASKQCNQQIKMTPPKPPDKSACTMEAPSLVTAVAKTLSDGSSQGGLYNLATDLNTVPTSDNNILDLNRPVPGTIQRAMSNIERAKIQTKSSSPLLSALARQTSTGLFDTLSERKEEKPLLKVHSSPAILATAIALPRNNSFGLSNAGHLHFGLGTPQRIRRHSSGSPTPADHSAVQPLLPPIPGSPTKSLNLTQEDKDTELKPLRGLFTAGSSPPSATMLTGDIIPFRSLPKYSGLEANTVMNKVPALVTPGKGTKVTRGFSDKPSGTRVVVASSHEVEPLSPDMEGTIALIAPELPEDTLMETEHTDGVRKLNFALSLVDAILDIVKIRGAPLTTIADSIALRMNESLYMDQIGNISDECRATEQLVLCIKSLNVLSLALQFAQKELNESRLKPSNAVRNVVNELNMRYHRCFERTSQIKASLQGKLTPGKSITTNADKLIYMYAMQLCQNAALDELFGNPQQCREKYETAQLLLQGLECDVKKDSDIALLQRYKMSVDRRLFQLSQRKTSAHAR